VTSDEWVATRGAQRVEGNTLVLLQINCTSIFNKFSDSWNLVDTYNTVIRMGTDSRFREEVSNVELFRDDYKMFKRDRNTRRGGVFICVQFTLRAWNYASTRISR
jgi:hypothetical protein